MLLLARYEKKMSTYQPTDDIQSLPAVLAALMQDEQDVLANLCNACALIYDGIPSLNWAGFYRLVDGVLVVGPFVGKPACSRIPLGKGVCGTAAKLDCTQIVGDVHAFIGHIACDAASASEMVVPLHRGDGTLWGVLDLDSPTRDRFASIQEVVLAIARQIERIL